MKTNARVWGGAIWRRILWRFFSRRAVTRRGDRRFFADGFRSRRSPRRRRLKDRLFGAAEHFETRVLLSAAPTAIDDFAQTTAGTPVSISVLANDSDPDGDVLEVISVDGVDNGSVSDSANVLTFTPAAGFIGTETFTYTITDFNGGTDTASVSVTVNAAADTVSLRAEADAQVRGGTYSNRNYGRGRRLNVRNHADDNRDFEAFLRFDLSGISGTIESAVLKLTPKAVGRHMAKGGEFRIRLLADADDNWVEGNGGTNNKPVNEIRWDNKPTGTGAELLVSGADLTVNQATSIDVTSLIGQTLNGNSVASFHLDVPEASNSRYVFFYSDEYGTAAYRPELVVTLAGDPQPTLPEISIGDATVTEGDDGTTAATFTVSLSAPASDAVTANFATRDGSAAGGSAADGADFAAASGTVSFAPGEVTQTVTIDVYGDTVDEGTENFFVDLLGIAGAVAGDVTGEGTILDDDSTSPDPNPDPTPDPSGGKRIVGYFPSWGIYGRNYQVSDIPAEKLTHVNYAFANIGSDLRIAHGDAYADSINFPALRTLKQQYPHLQTMISVGGWTWSEKFSEVALTAASRQ
ncbi:MAG: DNRLRE domain-containing protein, partial [Planctomycetota bacterium]